tara:strand:+ start:850 stop:2217 length:1368 start_codon:yes stop_codon:yes gene_type:complete
MASPDVAEPLAAYDLDVETLIIGAGAAGMIAALAAHEAGQNVLLIEADRIPSGSTALSAGLIPAAGTRFQANAGVADNAMLFADDIQKKAHGKNDPDLVTALTARSGPVIEWLADTHGLPITLLTDFDYPGHSRRRMHGLPTRSGQELIDALRSRIEALDIPLICNRRATRIFAKNAQISGAQLTLPDGSNETVGCKRLILACNGFGGNRSMVSSHMAEIDDALWFGHDGNRGDAIIWGNALGAATRHLSAYQGHGNVAHPHGILITWATIMQGGVQVNELAQRFWDESQGYSEAARAVLSQPGGVAWTIFDERIAAIARQFEDFKNAEAQGAILTADTLPALAEMAELPVEMFCTTIAELPQGGADRYGRRWNFPLLSPPFHAVKVTGALFHTQGGLDIDPDTAAVRDGFGRSFANLYAAGGAACGVSGSDDSGYLSGNGLLTAVVLGYLAGRG